MQPKVDNIYVALLKIFLACVTERKHKEEAKKHFNEFHCVTRCALLCAALCIGCESRCAVLF